MIFLQKENMKKKKRRWGEGFGGGGGGLLKKIRWVNGPPSDELHNLAIHIMQNAEKHIMGFNEYSNVLIKANFLISLSLLMLLYISLILS